MVNVIRIPITTGGFASSPSIDTSFSRHMPDNLKRQISQQEFKKRLQRIQTCLESSAVEEPRNQRRLRNNQNNENDRNREISSGCRTAINCSYGLIGVALLFVVCTAFAVHGAPVDIDSEFISQNQTLEIMHVLGGGERGRPGRPSEGRPVHHSPSGGGSGNSDVDPAVILIPFALFFVMALISCACKQMSDEGRKLSTAKQCQIQRLLDTFNREDRGRLHWELDIETMANARTNTPDTLYYISVTINPVAYIARDVPSTSTSSPVQVPAATPPPLIDFGEEHKNLHKTDSPPPAYEE